MPNENVVDWTSKFKGLKQLKIYRICKKTNFRNKRKLSLSSLFIECSLALFSNRPTHFGPQKTVWRATCGLPGHRVPHPWHSQITCNYLIVLVAFSKIPSHCRIFVCTWSSRSVSNLSMCALLSLPVAHGWSSAKHLW